MPQPGQLTVGSSIKSAESYRPDGHSLLGGAACTVSGGIICDASTAGTCIRTPYQTWISVNGSRAEAAAILRPPILC